MLLRDKELTLTVVNPNVSEFRDTQISVRGAKFKGAAATVLTHADIHAHNTFAQKDVVTPKTQSAESVTKLAIQLA